MWLPCWGESLVYWTTVDSWMAIGWAQTGTDHHRRASHPHLVSLPLALHRQDREQARPQRANNKSAIAASKKVESRFMR